MTISITKEQLVAFDPCGIDERLKLFGKRKSMNAKQAFAVGFSISDLLWIAGKLKLGAKCAAFAKDCAEHVAHLKNNHTYAANADAAAANAARAGNAVEIAWQKAKFLEIFNA